MSPFPIVSDLPAVTTDQMREVDRLMIEEYGVVLLQMMENAGRAVARVARARFLDGRVEGRRIVVLVGTGGNGGGGLVAARHLANGGADVQVWTARPSDAYSGVPAHQLGVLRRMGVPVSSSEIASADPELVVDALLGYSLEGPPRGVAADRIQWASAQAAPILSLDVPSGVDATTGEGFDPHIRATATVTLALPKTGLAKAPRAVGELYLADIAVPPLLYASLGLSVQSLFGEEEVLRVSV